MKNITMYYSYPNLIGGPSKYIETITDSYLREKYKFTCVYQNKPMGKLRFSDFKRIIGEIKNSKADIIHIHGLQSEGFIGVICSKIAGAKCILLTVHGMECDSWTNSALKKFVFKHFIEGPTLRLADYTFCVCEYTTGTKFIKNHVKKLLPAIQNCCPFDGDLYVKSLRQELGISEKSFVAIVVGRVTEMKGFSELAGVIQQIERPIDFLIVGDGPFLKTFQDILGERENVHFVGNQTDIQKYYSISDVYLSASYKENLSLSLLEAGYCGLPCIATDVGGTSEVIQDNYDGFLIPPHNIDEIKQRLEKLYDDNYLRECFSERIKEKIEKNFSRKVFLERIDSLYQKL